MGIKENNIINMSMEIVKKVGRSVYQRAFYECEDDKYIGEEYTFDGLKISYHVGGERKSKCLRIYIDDQELLYYNFDKNTIEFIDGKWTEIISTIYKQIPTILKEKQKDEEILNKKLQKLNSMRDSFKYYADSKKNQELRDIINIQLAMYGISIAEKEYYNQIRNRCEGNYENLPFPNHKYTVFHNNERVAEFDDDDYYVYLNLRNFAEKFVLGEWTNDFDLAINESKSIAVAMARRKADNSALEMMKKLKKTYNN